MQDSQAEKTLEFLFSGSVLASSLIDENTERQEKSSGSPTVLVKRISKQRTDVEIIEVPLYPIAFPQPVDSSYSLGQERGATSPAPKAATPTPGPAPAPHAPPSGLSVALPDWRPAQRASRGPSRGPPTHCLSGSAGDFRCE